MKVIVACEFSGTVRDAFLKRGHHATSCDILDTEVKGAHLKCDIRDVDISQYDLLIAHPPCTHLAVSGARWFKDKKQEQEEAIQFFMWLARQKIPYAIENPISIMSTVWRKPDQIIQPWQFGHGETKATCLWLNKLPPLKPTKIVEGREARIHKTPPSPDRWKLRSKTYQGIADAMAEQWGIKNGNE